MEFEDGIGVEHLVDFEVEYLRYLREDILVDNSPRVAIDGSNGSAGPLAVRALEEIGCRVETLYCNVDGLFPNHPPDNVNSSNLQDLISFVREKKADMGFALDGDGDRVIAVTSSGRIVWPDQMMLMFAEDILVSTPGATIVYDVKCSGTLASKIGSMGGRPMLTRSGRSYIADALRQNSAPFGGEYSGHLFFADRWFGTDDGIYAASRMIELVTRSGKTLDELLDALPTVFATEEITIEVDEESKGLLLSRFRRHIEQSSARILSIDGIRVEFPAGWGLLRSSNTGPKLTMRFEANSSEALEELQVLFRQTLNEIAPDMELAF